MIISVSERRHEISKALGDHGEDSHGLKDRFIEIDGIKVIDESNEIGFARDCVWFAFEGEPWYDRYSGELSRTLLGSHALVFLKSKGYQKIDLPKDFDIVAYGDEKTGCVRHYGICYDGNIISKFGDFPIMKHLVDNVPVGYGNLVTFLTKII